MPTAGQTWRVRDNARTRRLKLAGLRGTIREDMASHASILLPDAPRNPKADGSRWWSDRQRVYILQCRDLEGPMGQLDLLDYLESKGC